MSLDTFQLDVRLRLTVLPRTAIGNNVPSYRPQFEELVGRVAGPCDPGSKHVAARYVGRIWLQLETADGKPCTAFFGVRVWSWSEDTVTDDAGITRYRVEYL